MRPLSIFLVNASIFFLAFAACTKKPTPSRASHQEHEPAAGPQAWNWVNDTEDEYFQIVAKMQDEASDRSEFLPKDHPARERLKHWTDKIHDALVKKYPDAMKHVPRPDIQVKISSEVNAYVSPAPICFTNVGIDFGGAETISSQQAVLYNGSFLLLDGEQATKEECFQRKADRRELEERVAREFGEINGCQIEIKEEKEHFYLVPGPNCPIPHALRRIGKLRQLVGLSTSRWVTFLTGILAKLPESQAVSVLGHELGHYYRSHITTVRGYNYAYPLTFDRTPGRPPKPDPKSSDPVSVELRSITAAVNGWETRRALAEGEIDARGALLPQGTFQPVQGQKYHSAFTAVLARLAGDLQSFHCYMKKDAKCEASCDAAYKEREKYKKVWTYIIPMSQAETSQYLAFENNLEQCLKATSISKDDWRAGFVLEHYGKTAFRDHGLSAYFKVDGKETDMLAWASANNKLFIEKYPAFDAKNMTRFLEEKSAIDQILSDSVGLLHVEDELTKYVNTHKIGLYSTEQEADEIAAEYLSLIGVDPKYHVEVDLFLNELSENTDEYSNEPCRELYKNGWIKDGKPIIVPIGDLEEHHHGCFRAFNSDRDIVAHQFAKQYPLDAAFLESGAWEAMQKTLPGVGNSKPEVPSFTGIRGFSCKLGGFRLRP